MTEAEFSRQLTELSAAAADLNRESDSINELLSRFEEQIGSLNVGLEVSVWLYPEIESDKQGLQWRKMGRVPKGTMKSEEYWGLSVDFKPILDCSREQRIAALDQLPKLVGELKAQATQRVDVIKKAKGLLNK